MSVRYLPGLGLGAFFGLGFNGWDGDMDVNMRKLSAVAQIGVSSASASLPSSPSDGYMAIVPSSDSTNPNKLAIRDNGAWVYLTPIVGWSAYVIDTGRIFLYDGTAWIDLISKLCPSATFAPYGNGLTYSSATGKVTKLGAVNVIEIDVTTPTNSGSAEFRIGGIPFNLNHDTAGTNVFGINGTPAVAPMGISGQSYVVAALGDGTKATNAQMSGRRLLTTLICT